VTDEPAEIVIAEGGLTTLVASSVVVTPNPDFA